MHQLQELFAEYNRRPFPANIGDEISGIRLGELNDEVQSIIGSYLGMGLDIGSWRVARLGLVYGDIMRMLPEIAQDDTREYFTWLAALAHAALESMCDRDMAVPNID